MLKAMSLKIIICTIIILVSYLIGIPDIVFAESENKTAGNRMQIGRYKKNSEKTKLYVTCSLGIEHWEDNKRIDGVFYVWRILLHNDDTEIYMSLNIEKYISMEDEGLLMASNFNPTTINKLLAVDKIDFEEGILRFRFRLVEESEDIVYVNMRFIIDDAYMYLTKFKALNTITTVTIDELITIEYKIPEYTYVRNVPIKLNGFKTIEQKKYDDMLSTFSENEKTIFENVIKYYSSESYMSELEMRIKKIFPDYTLEDIDSGKVKLNDTELAKIPDTMKEIIYEYCVKEGMSKEATTQVTTYFEQVLK